MVNWPDARHRQMEKGETKTRRLWYTVGQNDCFEEEP